jgi:hypothetical protein
MEKNRGDFFFGSIEEYYSWLLLRQTYYSWLRNIIVGYCWHAKLIRTTTRQLSYFRDDERLVSRTN